MEGDRGGVEALPAALRGRREHVLGIVAGLDEEAVRRPALPSGWNCPGLPNHPAVDDERFWFPLVVAGDPEGVPAADVVAGYRAQRRDRGPSHGP